MQCLAMSEVEWTRLVTVNWPSIRKAYPPLGSSAPGSKGSSPACIPAPCLFPALLLSMVPINAALRTLRDPLAATADASVLPSRHYHALFGITSLLLSPLSPLSPPTALGLCPQPTSVSRRGLDAPLSTVCRTLSTVLTRDTTCSSLCLSRFLSSDIYLTLCPSSFLNDRLLHTRATRHAELAVLAFFLPRSGARTTTLPIRSTSHPTWR